MDDRCRVAHAKLLAGTCPWCGQFIVNGKVEGQPEINESNMPEDQSVEQPLQKTLQERVTNRGVLSSEEAISVIEAIANELAAVHRTGQVYRSLTPSQVLVLGEDRFRLNISSRVVDEAGTVSDADETIVISIADYLAPEQALNSSRPDCRSDIYSLGCVLYFMLVGKAPFDAGSISERLLKHQIQQPTPISALRDGVPTGLVAICVKMMEKKPQYRYQTAEDLISAINAWKEKRP